MTNICYMPQTTEDILRVTQALQTLGILYLIEVIDNGQYKITIPSEILDKLKGRTLPIIARKDFY